MHDSVSDGVNQIVDTQLPGPTIGVFAAAFDEQHRILCVRQAYSAQRWTNPGGRLENGEDPRAGVLRELHEETGYHGIVTGFLGTYVALYKKPTDLILFFQVQLMGRDPWRPNEEISHCAFFTADELPQPMAYNSRVRMLDAFRAGESTLRVFSTPDSHQP
jgi:ADP-ribose pyrophosphatase YjhB (NUDIX family)